MNQRSDFPDKAVRARNLDLAIEHHGPAGQAAALTLFWKKVDGFIARPASGREAQRAVLRRGHNC